MRKNANLELTDRIIISYEASEEITKAIKAFEDYIKKETLATKIENTVKDGEEFNINDEVIKIAISKK